MRGSLLAAAMSSKLTLRSAAGPGDGKHRMHTACLLDTHIMFMHYVHTLYCTTWRTDPLEEGLSEAHLRDLLLEKVGVLGPRGGCGWEVRGRQ